MTNTTTNAPKTNYTNPLQNNVTITMGLGYAAGVLASKFPLFDADTWNALLLAAGGFGFVLYTAITTRKTTVVATAANLPEVKSIALDAKVEGVHGMANVTPDNVVVK